MNTVSPVTPQKTTGKLHLAENTKRNVPTFTVPVIQQAAYRWRRGVPMRQIASDLQRGSTVRVSVVDVEAAIRAEVLRFTLPGRRAA